MSGISYVSMFKSSLSDVMYFLCFSENTFLIVMSVYCEMFKTVLVSATQYSKHNSKREAGKRKPAPGVERLFQVQEVYSIA